ncbi:MAG: LysE family translocator [Geodermatophilaceae bacterium]|nr:LysE family translocator [Geodermatophilaceae bacterium]
MPSGPTLAAFAAASVLLILLPGPAMLFLLARGIAGGRRVGIYSALGVESASAVYVAATALGLTAVLAASGTALGLVRYVGAAYLIWLGVVTIRKRNDPLVPASPASSGSAVPGAGVPAGAWRSWRQGFAVGITNPKVALFFLAFFPQFIHPEAGPLAAQVLVLGALFVLIGAVLDVGYGLSGGLLGDLLGRHPKALPHARVGVGLTFLTLGGVTAATGHKTA